jgi:hypothetical protein
VTASSITFDGVSLGNSAIKIRNLWTFWEPAQLEASNIKLAGVTGVTARKPLVQPTTHSLELVISGQVSTTGTPDTNYPSRLKTNLAYIATYFTNIPTTADGTRTAVLTLPSAATITGPVHILGLTIGEVVSDARWALAVLEVSVPAGVLA